MRKSIVLAGIVMAAAVALPAAAQPRVTSSWICAGSCGGCGDGRGRGNHHRSRCADPPRHAEGRRRQGRGGDGGPEVKNFDRLHVGDRVALQVFKSLTLELKKGSTAVVSRSEETAKVGGEAGQQPGGALGRQVTVMAEVIGVDAENQVVTLKGPNRSVDLEVRDPEQFKLIAVGDRVEATYTEAVAVSISPAKAE